MRTYAEDLSKERPFVIFSVRIIRGALQYNCAIKPPALPLSNGGGQSGLIIPSASDIVQDWRCESRIIQTIGHK
jgi:hypothetical protein